jgi:hypothetical protein
MNDTVATVIGYIVGSQALFSFLTVVVTKLLDRKSTSRKILAAVSYSTLTDKIEQRLDEDFATPEQRRELDILFEAYKAAGWNGDMEERMKKVYALPTKDLRRELKEIQAKLP